MRQDKLSQRLKLRRDSFDFNALIEGVSTLIEDDKREVAAPAEPAGAVRSPEPPAAIERIEDRSAPLAIEDAPVPPAPAVLPTAPAAPLTEHLFVEYEVVQPAPKPAPAAAPSPPARERAASAYAVEVTAQEAALLTPRPTPEPPTTEEELASVPVAEAAPAPETPVSEAVAAPAAHAAPAAAAAEAPIGLRAASAVAPAPFAIPAYRPASIAHALESLSGRLVQIVSRMRAALYADDPDEAGFYLAHANQVLELLSTLDPTGDVAREQHVHHAPPAGRAWPGTAWSVVEFADSPLSGLLPAWADARFVQRLLYSAWGVSLDSVEERDDQPALAAR